MMRKGWLLAALMILLCTVQCGTQSADLEDESVVVPPGKADNFFSLSAQEYMVEGTSYVELEAELDDADEATRMARVKELVYYRQIAVNWFLLQFLMGPEDDHDNKFESLTKNGSYDDLEILPVEGNSRRFTFKFRQEVGGQMDLLEELPTTLGEDGRHHFQLPVGVVSNAELAKLELDKEWYRKSPWSGFDPSKVQPEQVETLDLAVWPEERSSDGWIDYNRLFEDGELTISLHFGWDYHKEYHLVHSRDVYNWLVGQGFDSPVASYEAYDRTSGPLTRTITANGKEIKVSVSMYWGKPGTATDPDTDAGGQQLEDDMIAAFATHDVVMFSGHSGPFYGFALANWRKTSKGDIDDSEIPELVMPADRYQVVLAEGCDTYALGQAFWANPNKSDRDNLDIITTTNFSNASTAGVVRNFLTALFQTDVQGRHTPNKYSDLLKRLDGNSTWFHSMYGVHGIDDNPRLHPYAAVASFCENCQQDVDCGGPGNACTRLNDQEKVCTAECLSTEACPAGYQCMDVASGSWVQSRQCVPVGLTCVTVVEPDALPVVVINEVLADPAPDALGDANGDGVRSAIDDEFVELVSTSAQPVDLSGWFLADGFGTRFVFPSGAQLLPGRAVLVFGGGDSDLALDFFSVTGTEAFFGGGLGLNNSGDSLTLYRADGSSSDAMTYGGEGAGDRSLVRATEGDPLAPFVVHPGDAPFSPGTRMDGTLF
jgi:hypothetical protein